MNKKRFLITLTFLCLFSLVLASCGGGQAPTTMPAAEEEAVVEEAPAAEEEAPEHKDYSQMTLAGVFEDLVNDGGYTQKCFESLGYAEKTLGVRTTYQERVSAADAPAVLRDYGNQGVDVIASYSGGTVGAVQEVAPQYPDSSFIILAAKNTEFSDNVWIIGHDYTADFYLLGALAGMMTETNIIGFVGGGQYASYVASAMSFEEGARYVNPDIEEVYVAFAGAFDDPLAAKQAAESQFSNGADIIASAVGSTGDAGIFEAAREAGGYITTMGRDRTSDAPDIVLTGIVLAYPEYTTEIVERVAAGERGGYIVNNIVWGKNTLAPFLGKVPAEVEERLNEIMVEMRDGKIDYTTEEEVQQMNK